MRTTLFIPTLLISLTCLVNQTALASDMPADAEALMARFRSDEQAIKQRAEQALKPKWERLIQDLTALKVSYTKAGDLDAAVAIRDRIQELQTLRGTGGVQVRPDPGTPQQLGNLSPGQVYFVKLVGAKDGSLWGSDMYTTDSTLALAAVHAGVVQIGATRIVKITIHPGRPQYTGSVRNGVASASWNAFDLSFTIERAP